MDLDQLKKDLLAQIEKTVSVEELEKVRVAALGKKGTISLKLKELGKVAQEERKVLGASINRVKQAVTEALELRSGDLSAAEMSEKLASERLDLSLPVPPTATMKGRLHPISQIIDEMTAIFSDMGFSIAEGHDAKT